MIVWINGPFGGGKTQTAHELHRRLPGSTICDPEDVGFGLNRMLPPSLRGDFQDLPPWRVGVLEMVTRLASDWDGTVIVPMTLVVPEYFDEIVGGLRAAGVEVCHVALLASREIILRRLRERVFGHAVDVLGGGARALRRESFAVSKLDQCLETLVQSRFATQIDTDVLPIPAVADRVAELAGLTLQPNDDAPWRQRLRRTAVGVRHIRLG